ncbi:hypothetical protein Scep_021368 [Stephania cephalantha]|uniref:Uncharacterized protein n=1 Tax=Stephania cephalantha TaxID=152367 RepID=A0AAP0F483_9MAGN
MFIWYLGHHNIPSFKEISSSKVEIKLYHMVRREMESSPSYSPLVPKSTHVLHGIATELAPTGFISSVAYAFSYQQFQ